MTAIALLLAAAAAGFGIAKWLQIPALPILVLMGFLTTFTGALDQDLVTDALILGLTIMVFVAGIELNPTKVGRQKRLALQVGTLQFVVLGALGIGIARLLGFDVQTAAYIGLALTASSTLVVVRLLQKRRQLYEPVGRFLIGVLLLQDLLVIMLIPVLTRIPEGWGSVAIGLLATSGLALLAWVCLKWAAPALVQKVAFDEESLLLVVLGLLFIFLGLADLFDLPLIAGAFFAGVSLSGFPANSVVRGQLNSLSDFFSALFFTALGAFLLLPTAAELLQALALALGVIVLTPPLVAIVTERAGFSARPAVLGGLLLSQTSEFSLVVGLQGVVLAQIAPEAFTIIVLTTLITMVITPVIASDSVTWGLMKLHPFRHVPTIGERPRGHVLLIGCGQNGISLLETLIVGPHEVVVVDDDPALIERLRDARVRAIRGDASDFEVLRSAGADQARIVISTIRRTEDNGPLLAFTHDVPVLVRAFNVEDARWIEERGGRPILYSEAGAADFLRWFEASDGGRISLTSDELGYALGPEGSKARARRRN